MLGFTDAITKFNQKFKVILIHNKIDSKHSIRCTIFQSDKGKGMGRSNKF